jgi:pimeloyl-ACP methyl ester carboxylesterase
MTEILPRAARGEPASALMLAADRKERIARLSLVGPAALMPELLPVPAHGAGSFDEAGLRVVWADVPLEQVASAAQAIHAALMAPR